MNLGLSIYQYHYALRRIQIVKYFQAKVGRWEAFEIALQRLRGEHANISYERSEIKVK